MATSSEETLPIQNLTVRRMYGVMGYNIFYIVGVIVVIVVILKVLGLF